MQRSAVVRLEAVSRRRARRDLDALIAEAGSGLAAAAAGDLAALYAAHRAVGGAVQLLLAYRWDAAMTAPDASIGGRPAPSYPPLPPDGPHRQAALRQFMSVISADVAHVISIAVVAGCDPLDHEEIADRYVDTFRVLAIEAVAAGVRAWRDAQPRPTA